MCLPISWRHFSGRRPSCAVFARTTKQHIPSIMLCNCRFMLSGNRTKKSLGVNECLRFRCVWCGFRFYCVDLMLCWELCSSNGLLNIKILLSRHMVWIEYHFDCYLLNNLWFANVKLYCSENLLTFYKN